MSKILENDFRRELYKNLVEAGYSKEESQKIVGAKYYTALNNNVKEIVGAFLSEIESENYENGLNCEELTAKLGDLRTLKELLSK